jgi:hypothetical protein
MKKVLAVAAAVAGCLPVSLFAVSAGSMSSLAKHSQATEKLTLGQFWFAAVALGVTIATGITLVLSSGKKKQATEEPAAKEKVTVAHRERVKA